MDFPFNRTTSKDFLLKKSEALKSSVASGASGVRTGFFGGFSQMQTKFDQLSTKFGTSTDDDDTATNNLQQQQQPLQQQQQQQHEKQKQLEGGSKATSQENQCDQSSRKSSVKKRPPKPPLPKQLSRCSIDRGGEAPSPRPQSPRQPQSLSNEANTFAGAPATSNVTPEINCALTSNAQLSDVRATNVVVKTEVNSISDANTAGPISGKSPRQPTDLLPGIPRNSSPAQGNSLAAPSTDLLAITPTSGAALPAPDINPQPVHAPRTMSDDAAHACDSDADSDVTEGCDDHVDVTGEDDFDPASNVSDEIISDERASDIVKFVDSFVSRILSER